MIISNLSGVWAACVLCRNLAMNEKGNKIAGFEASGSSTINSRFKSEVTSSYSSYDETISLQHMIEILVHRK